MRPLLILVAMGLPIEAMAAPSAANDGFEVTICTADGAQTLTLDKDGRPVPPDFGKACAHAWCEPRRPRPTGRPSA